MSGDRSSSSPRRNDGGRSGASRSGAGRPGRPASGGRSGGGKGGSGKSSGRSGGGEGNRSDRGGGRGGRDEKYKSDRPPLTEADRRSMDVKRRRGPKPEPDLEALREAERLKIEARTTEQWIDEGSVRDAARAAATRGAVDDRPRAEPQALDPEIAAQLSDALGAQRGQRLSERLAQASEALDRERFDEAKRIATAIAKEAPSVAVAHEVVGLSNYRLGRFKQAASALQAANDLHENPDILPVLADCYRALERWSSVERIWLQIRESSPAHDVLAEGRIVAAGALADRGDLPAAIELMLASTKNTKKVKDHHLRQWYVLADLYDRLNDPIKARRWFGAVAEVDPNFVDVQTRLRHIGR